MKNVLLISYWGISILLLAFVTTSFGYTFMESVFMTSLYLPGALAVKYLFPKVSFAERKKGIADVICITSGIIVAEIFLSIIAHYHITKTRWGVTYPLLGNDEHIIPQILVNPVFISLMIAVLSVGNYYFEKWLIRKFPSEEKPVIFLSDRKQISLMRSEILYIESNDSVTTVYASGSRSFRNKTPISQWESFLGDGFIRIHRSFLVNADHISEHNTDCVTVDDTELPVSRKYRDAVKNLG